MRKPVLRDFLDHLRHKPGFTISEDGGIVLAMQQKQGPDQLHYNRTADLGFCSCMCKQQVSRDMAQIGKGVNSLMAIGVMECLGNSVIMKGCASFSPFVAFAEAVGEVG